ncbi:proline iminopeptidase [Chrysochromulina tobinii]|uniref:Proline iminopeptidase n=1 Tax=Chrysochromulina tobinii TaxID=1460289 RepID=A0A0M0JGZ1_9EUKA|nr:proline iminopeptidase [Chrysochromulina tobinii]|eukprot:KOO25854.1 proline iminopeptidase [Chrysochromulina sp. CCMP291]
MLRPLELSFFYQDGASMIFPDAWAAYEAHIPPAERGDMIAAYHKRLTSTDEATRLAAAKQWTTWEMCTSFAKPNAEQIAKGEDPKFAEHFARIEAHYFVNKGFFPTETYLLDHVDRIRHIPTFIVQGRYDVVCPMRSAFDLSQAFPEAELVICGQSGHSANEPETISELVMACDRFKLDIRPVTDWTWLMSGQSGSPARLVQRPWPEYVPESSAAVGRKWDGYNLSALDEGPQSPLRKMPRSPFARKLEPLATTPQMIR